jgi:hypothetical protein
MRKSWLLSLPLLFACVPPCHADDWSSSDSYRQAALTALLVADWAQTRWAIKHNENLRYCGYNAEPCRFYKEQNPLLGEHPTIGKVNNLIGASILGHAAIAYMLPRGWREGWTNVWIGVEASAVYYNRSVGLKMAF